jgi:hypothetical protein
MCGWGADGASLDRHGACSIEVEMSALVEVVPNRGGGSGSRHAQDEGHDRASAGWKRRFRWRESYLTPVPIAARSKPEKTKAATAKPPTASPKRGRPIPADHPWRTRPFLVGKALDRPQRNVASRAYGASAFADPREGAGITST